MELLDTSLVRADDSGLALLVVAVVMLCAAPAAAEALSAYSMAMNRQVRLLAETSAGPRAFVSLVVLGIAGLMVATTVVMTFLVGRAVSGP
jgi:hypothetical protein